MAKQTKQNPLELYGEWYLNELKQEGFIKKIKREPFSFNIARKKKHSRYVIKELKNKSSVSVEEYNILQEQNYTFDYLVVWDVKAKDYFFNLLDEGTPIKFWCPFYAHVDKEGNFVSFIDVKPPSGAMMFGNNTTSYTFPIIQKIIYSDYNIFINKTIPIPLMSKGSVKSGNKNALFTTTFVPQRYRLTDGGNQARVIHYRNRTLKEYLFEREKQLKKINSLLCSQSSLNL